MHAVITYGARSRAMIEGEIEARLRILDTFDAPTALLDLEADNDAEDIGDAEPEGATFTM